jgi:hypothetical protein
VEDLPEEKEEPKFDKDLNLEMLAETVRDEEQIKYTNPIRDYRHILANRLVLKLIDLKYLIDKKETIKEA